ncbi:MAG TPA: histidine kinase, partial [Chloroflexota bacterium]
MTTPFLEDMPASHHLAVPFAAALGLVTWLLDLVVGGSWSRRLLIAVVVLGNLWLTALGHISNNYLLLMLLVAWIGVSGSRAESLGALLLSLATFVLSALLGAPAPGQIAWAARTSWSAGVVGVWLMASLFVRQGRLVAELQRLATDNAALTDKARQAAVLEERQRLVRELHDSVTQSLYGISLQAEAGARALADGEP